MAIIIKELYDSDTISELVEKSNFNWDQLIAAGGGPAGPEGPEGQPGPAGGEGIRGSQWFASDGSGGIINTPTDLILRTNDFRLATDSDPGATLGQVEYYDASGSGAWIDSGINIRGPQGPKGEGGDGAIAVIHSVPSDIGGFILPNETELSLNTLSGFLTGVDSDNDKDDEAIGTSYINSGQDFAVIGHGNNSLVLGRYKSIFDVSTNQPNFDNWPISQSDVPMLIVAQNDYQDPNSSTSTDQEFNNGIAIGLNLTHQVYDPTVTQVDVFGAYDSFTKLRTVNRDFDFRITSPGHIELDNRGTNKIRLSSGFSRNNSNATNIRDWCNLIDVDTFLNISSGDNIVIDHNTTIDPNTPNIKEIIQRTDSATVEIQTDIDDSAGKSYISGKHSMYITNDNNTDATEYKSTELTMINNNSVINRSTNSRYSGRTTNEEIYSQSEENNTRNLKFRVGQTNVGGIFPSQTFDTMNMFYMGQGYDTPLVGYSSANFRIPSGQEAFGATATGWQLYPADSADFEKLGYNILDPVATGTDGTTDVTKEKSITRLGIFPGIFNQKIDPVTGLPDANDSEKNENLLEFFDEGHRLLPTGSLDLYGTLRIRENGYANDSEKDGYVAINAGKGIMKWEDPSVVGVPTGAITMVSELAIGNFNFFAMTQFQGNYNTTTSSGYIENAVWARNNGNVGSTIGGTSIGGNFWSGAFPGKGFDSWAGYYICSGAVLADTRDCVARGRFSTSGGGIHTYRGEMEKLVSNPYFTDKSPYGLEQGIQGKRYFYSDEEGKDWFPTSNADDFISAIIELANDNSSEYNLTGLSLLSPRTTDSKFRLVLPNYFGRFPKQQFPSSYYLSKSFSDVQFDFQLDLYRPDPNLSGAYVYNTTYPLASAFTTGGYPYVRRESLPIHQHWTGTYKTIKEGTSIGSNITVVDPVANQKDPYYYSSSNSNKANITTGWPSNSGTNRNVDPLNAGGNQFDYFTRYDYLTNKSSYRYPKEAKNNLKFRYQRTTEPVFRGTYFAINLRGLRNPNRGNTLIPDLDFLSNVPYSGYKNSELAKNLGKIDLSWFNHPAMIHERMTTSRSPINNGDFSPENAFHVGYTSDDSIVANTDNLVKVGWYAHGDLNVPFESIYRNEANAHPTTLYRPTDDDDDDDELVASTGKDFMINLFTIYRNVYDIVYQQESGANAPATPFKE